jgi:hypothetical protein
MMPWRVPFCFALIVVSHCAYAQTSAVPGPDTQCAAPKCDCPPAQKDACEANALFKQKGGLGSGGGTGGGIANSGSIRGGIKDFRQDDLLQLQKKLDIDKFKFDLPKSRF